MSDLPPFIPSISQPVEQPIPGWKLGEGVDSTENGKKWLESINNGWKTIDTSTEDKIKLYNLMKSGIVPRPVAFVSSISESGVENLAPFSFFNMVSHIPAVISISSAANPARKAGVKDTAHNILTTKEFVVNIISEPWVVQANFCATEAPPETSEWELSGLTKEPSISVKPPRVRESAFSMECELLQAIPIIEPVTNTHGSTLILGRVKFIHVLNDIYEEQRGNANFEQLNPVGRLGGISYARLLESYALPNIKWEDASHFIDTAAGGSL